MVFWVASLVIISVLKTSKKILGYRYRCSVAVLSYIIVTRLPGMAPLQRVDFFCAVGLWFQRSVYTIGARFRSGGVNRFLGACVGLSINNCTTLG
jgi:hypothetical protein